MDELVEHDEFWTLPLAGRTITQCRVDAAFSLVSCEPECDDVVIRVASFRLSDSPITFTAEGEREALGPALTLYQDRVAEATAWKSGRLELVFASGRRMTADPDPDYEAWEISGPSRILLVCLAGGGVAVWG